MGFDGGEDLVGEGVGFELQGNLGGGEGVVVVVLIVVSLGQCQPKVR